MSDETPQAPAVLGDAVPSLEELFNRDPLEWTDPNIDTIVEALRAQRNKFNLTEGVKQVEGKTRGKAAALPKPKKPDAPAGGKLSLDDLGLL